MVSAADQMLVKIKAAEQRLKDIAAGSQGQPKLFCAAVAQVFNIDLPQREWNILPKYDMDKVFDLRSVAATIVRREEGL